MRTVACESWMARDDVERIALHQHDVRRLDRHVRARADRDADVGLRQRRRVVHAVADHRDPLAFAAGAAATYSALSCGQHLGEHALDASSRATASAVRRLSPVIIDDLDASS